MRTATRNGVKHRYVEVWDDDGEPEQRVYLHSMPSGLTYSHYCVEQNTIKEFEAGLTYSVVAWKHMREIEEPKAEPEPAIDWKARAEKAEKLLAEAVGYLRQGKQQFTPHTTNSLVDDFIKRNSKDEKYFKIASDRINGFLK